MTNSDPSTRSAIARVTPGWMVRSARSKSTLAIAAIRLAPDPATTCQKPQPPPRSKLFRRSIGPEGRKNVAPAVRPGKRQVKSDRGPEGRKIDSEILRPDGAWVTTDRKTPAFGRGCILTALRAY